MVSSSSAGGKSWLRRKVGSLGNMWLMTCAFLGGIFASFIIFYGRGTDLSLLQNELSAQFRPAADVRISDERTPSVVVHSDTSATEGFLNAWRQDRETCEQWKSMQALSHSYLDAYVIGSQKGATSEITKRLHKLGVRRPDMKKEWHYFTKLEENGTLSGDIKSHVPLSTNNLKALRYAHYKTGFPDDTKASVDWLPGLDMRSASERLLTYDSTVEHFHTDKAAFIAHALTPHAKIVVTVRNPIDRAISQFNMVVRGYNKANREAGKGTRPASPDWFHEVVTNEIEKITSCGYDAQSATIDRPTSKMLSCVFGEGKVKFENLLYVTRGLYHIHIATWRNYFPDHRMLVLSFSEVTTGRAEPYQDLAKFLCIRPFPEELLKSFKESGSTLSYGQQVAKGMENKGTDTYDATRNNSYMIDIEPKTRQLLDDFYRPANRKLEALLGRKMFEYAE